MPAHHRLGRAIVLVPLLVATCILAGYIGTTVFFARTHDAPLVKVAALAKRHAAHLSEDGLQFEIPLSAPVAMSIGDTVRYQLNDPFAEEEYARLMPSGGHLVYVHDAGRPRGDAVEEPGPRAYTVTLFHQLKCLDIIRRELTDDSLETPTIRAAHCMNYLRQMIICRVNTRLESIKHSLGAVDRLYQATCKNWSELLYEEAERNQQAYAAWANSTK